MAQSENNGWVKLQRKFMSWEWYDSAYMVKLFIHLILSANHTDKKWRGTLVKRGQLITGLKSLSLETNMSIKVIRTCLDKLQKTGEIGRQSGNRYSIITINNYDSYQINETKQGKPTGKQRANKGQTKGNKQELKEREELKKQYAEFVYLTEKEYQTLIDEHGKQNTETFIKTLDNYKGSSGKKYKSDYRAIRMWVIDRIKEKNLYVKVKDETRSMNVMYSGIIVGLDQVPVDKDFHLDWLDMRGNKMPEWFKEKLRSINVKV